MAKAKGGSSVGNLWAYLGLDDTEFAKGMVAAEKTMNKVGKQMSSVGRTLTTTLTLPLVGAGTAAVKMAMDFERTFAEIEGLVGLAREEVNGFKEDVMRLSIEAGRGPQELANALYFVTSSGIQGAEAIDVLEMSAKAAAAGLGETQVIADLLSSALNAYADTGLTAKDATDALVASVREGKAEGKEMSKYLGDVLSIAAKMGVSFQEVGASVAVMTRTGVDAATAVTNLRGILSSLLDPAAHSDDLLKEMGTSASELRQAIKEKGLLSVLQWLEEQTKSNEEAMAEIFPNIRAMAGAMEIVSVNAKENAQVFANLKDNTGDLDRAFAAVSDTASFKFNQGLAELKVAAIDLGTILLPIFTDFVRLIKDAANWFRSLSDEGKKTVIMIAAFAAALGPILITMGSLITLLAGIATPVGIAIVAIGALATAFIYLYENWEAVVERISDWAWWRNMLISMTQFLITYNPVTWFVRKAIEGLNFLIDSMNKVLPYAVAKIPDFFDPMIDGLEEMKVETKNYEHQFKGFTETIVDFAKKAGNALLGLFPSGGGRPSSNPATSTPTAPGDASALPTFTPESETWEEYDPGVFKLVHKAALDLDTLLKNMIAKTFVDFGEALGQLFTGEVDVAGFFNKMLIAVADFAIEFGKQLVMAGVAALAFKKLLANPALAIVAGLALTAAAFAVKSTLMKGPDTQGLATGGYVTDGGVFRLHKDETVALPTGSAVVSAGGTRRGMSGGNGGGSLSASISMRRLVIELEKEQARMNR